MSSDPADWNNYPVIDPSAIEELRALDDSPEFGLLQELVSMLRGSTPAAIAHIQDALAKGDAKTLASEAHRMKSSAANLGATRMSKICAALEASGRSGSLQGCQNLITALEREYKGALDELASFVKKPGL